MMQLSRGLNTYAERVAVHLSAIPVNESSGEGERSDSGKGKEKGIAYS
jgi:hypothetical protein